MIRYPVTVKALKKVELESEKQVETVEEIIANDEGEILGRKGSVAKLAQAFKVNSNQRRLRSNSLGRINSIIPNRKTFNSNYQNSQRKPILSNIDYSQLDEAERMFTENQSSVKDLLKLYDNSNQIRIKSEIAKSNSLVQKSTNNFRNSDENQAYDCLLRNYKSITEELRKRDEFLTYRNRKDSVDNKRYTQNHDNYLVNHSGTAFRSRWEDYKISEQSKSYSNKNLYDKNNALSIIDNPNENLEEEFIETWEETHTVPYVEEIVSEKPNSLNFTHDPKSNLDLSSRSQNYKLNKSFNELPPHLQSSHSNGKTDSHNKLNQTPVGYIHQRKSLAEVFSEYQQKGNLPSTECHSTEFPIRRRSFFIENNVDTTSAAKTIDLVSPHSHIIKNNANPYQNTFHVAKENPLYTNNMDFQDTIGKNRWRIN